MIDIQKGFHHPGWGERNNHQAEANALRLLTHWREKGWPVVHIQHLSTTPGSTLHPQSVWEGERGADFQTGFEPLPGEVHLTKNVNSAFIGTDLEQRLRAAAVTQLVIAGLTTDHCVSTTTRMAANLGFDVVLVSDAIATFEREFDGQRFSADEIHRIHLASLSGEFATVKPTAALLT